MSPDSDNNLSCKWSDCTKIFNTKENLVGHVEMKHLKNNEHATCLWENCENYQLKNLDDESTIDHIRAHLRLNPYTCNFNDCKKTYKRFDAFLKHYNVHLLEGVAIRSPDSTPGESTHGLTDKVFKSKRNLEKQLTDSIKTPQKGNKADVQGNEEIEELQHTKNKSFLTSEFEKKLYQYEDSITSVEKNDDNVDKQYTKKTKHESSFLKTDFDGDYNSNKGSGSVSISESDSDGDTPMIFDSSEAINTRKNIDRSQKPDSKDTPDFTKSQKKQKRNFIKSNGTKESNSEDIINKTRNQLKSQSAVEKEKNYTHAAQILEARIAIVLENINYNEMCLYKAIKKKERLQVENKVLIDSILKRKYI
ncbi:hypothetical protein BB561_005372 [Smittium simulii]|uniref:C2H2-type domain-containing protein n=1 Tax=Smittium simulii TaxID=133385 RepID=A0A2T9YAS1_9FUNG|nr:hypothetical protein BB561_005372 [Smittium simulii]